jgi:ribulose-phosphate 3-epimerase
MVKIIPTLACANYLYLQDDIKALEKAGVSCFHVDIMDGNFVPNYCMNWDIIKQIKSISNLEIDLHLMVQSYERDIKAAIDIDCDYIAFHIENARDCDLYISLIKAANKKVGIVLNPNTPVSSVLKYLDSLDYIILMGVEPGFSGQQFQRKILSKIELLNDIKTSRHLSFEIEVDGGISFENVKEIISNGADSVIAGALCIFDGECNLEQKTKEFIDYSNC